MIRVEKLEKDIQKLNRHELAALLEWLRNYDATEWDRQIEEDVESGRISAFVKESLTDYKTGKTKEL